MNSLRPPQDGNFCLGVWEQTGRSKYYLNHFPCNRHSLYSNATNRSSDGLMNFVLGELLSGYKLDAAGPSHTFGGYIGCSETLSSTHGPLFETGSRPPNTSNIRGFAS